MNEDRYSNPDFTFIANWLHSPALYISVIQIKRELLDINERCMPPLPTSQPILAAATKPQARYFNGQIVNSDLSAFLSTTHLGSVGLSSKAGTHWQRLMDYLIWCVVYVIIMYGRLLAEPTNFCVPQ